MLTGALLSILWPGAPEPPGVLWATPTLRLPIQHPVWQQDTWTISGQLDPSPSSGRAEGPWHGRAPQPLKLSPGSRCGNSVSISLTGSLAALGWCAVVITFIIVDDGLVGRVFSSPSTRPPRVSTAV